MGHRFMVGKEVIANPAAIGIVGHFYGTANPLVIETANPSAIGMVGHFFMVGKEATTR